MQSKTFQHKFQMQLQDYKVMIRKSNNLLLVRIVIQKYKRLKQIKYLKGCSMVQKIQRLSIIFKTRRVACLLQVGNLQ